MWIRSQDIDIAEKISLTADKELQPPIRAAEQFQDMRGVIKSASHTIILLEYLYIALCVIFHLSIFINSEFTGALVCLGFMMSSFTKDSLHMDRTSRCTFSSTRQTRPWQLMKFLCPFLQVWHLSCSVSRENCKGYLNRHYASYLYGPYLSKITVHLSCKTKPDSKCFRMRHFSCFGDMQPLCWR